MRTYTHKISGWTRQHVTNNDWRITPADDSGERVVAFLSAGTWQNLPNDNPAHTWHDRVVLRSGNPLPAWAVSWLTGAARHQAQSGRRELARMIAQADFDEAMREGW